MSKHPPKDPEHSREREFKVILEDLQSQFRVFGEGLHDVRERLERVENDVTDIKGKVHVMDSAFPRFFAQLSSHETRITSLENTSH